MRSLPHSALMIRLPRLDDFVFVTTFVCFHQFIAVERTRARSIIVLAKVEPHVRRWLEPWAVTILHTFHRTPRPAWPFVFRPNAGQQTI